MKGVVAGTASPFGARLRRWRRHRGTSQLTLAGQVGSTPRHISFLETGRSRSSRQMVLRLGEVLGVSLRERNQLLAAAGLPEAYPQAPVTGPQLAPYRAAIDRLVHAHQPYPGMVLDGHWNVLITNRACAKVFGGDLVGANMVRHFLADPAAAAAVVNWPEVSWAGLVRLRQLVDQAPLDQELRELVALAETAVAGVPRPSASGPDLVVCPWFRMGDEVVRTIAMAARFDPVADVTLDELRVEPFYPLDDAAERFFRAQGQSPTPSGLPEAADGYDRR
jgi:transcriptional regulator with XRE-family HTH domain